MASATHLLPLVDVADEPGQTQQTEQAEDFGEADYPQRPGRPVDLRVQTVHHQEDVVHRDGRHEVHEEPGLQVLLADCPEVEKDGEEAGLIWLGGFVEVSPVFAGLSIHQEYTGT